MNLSTISFQTSFKKLLWWTLKLIVIVLLGGIIFDKIIAYESTNEIVTNLNKNWAVNNNWPFLILCLLLMFVNWGLETLKWQRLTAHFYKWNFKQASESILLGISLGIVTPSRIGEYGGRVINLPPQHRSQGIQSHLLSSLSQNIINLFFGGIGGFLYLYLYSDLSIYLIVAVSTIALIVSFLLTTLYFGNGAVLSFVHNKLPDWISSKINVEFTTTFDDSVLNKALLISGLRYFIFVGQYVLLLVFFGIEVPVLAMVSGVALIYLIQSGVPLPPFLSMLARGEIAIVIWSMFSVSAISILSATFALWILNLLLPALVGAIILVRKS